MGTEEFLKTRDRLRGGHDVSGALMQPLHVMPVGGLEMAEAPAASAGEFGDEEAWHRRWAGLAKRASRRASTEAGQGCAEAAKANWLRAIHYDHLATLPFDEADARAEAGLKRMRACAQAFLCQGEPQGEVVTIPWRADYSLQGYFLPAPAAQRPGATVICFSEPGQRKEAQLPRLARLAAERGLSLLCVDLLGDGPAARFADIVGCRDLESAVGSAMDYLSMREDVDEDRIGIVADEWSSSFVARGIALDQRYAAAACDAGLWDMHERAFLARRLDSGDAPVLASTGAGRVARHILCPVLIALREQGGLDVNHAKGVVSQMRADRPDILLQVFSHNPYEPAGRQAIDASVLDWMAARLTRPTRHLAGADGDVRSRA